MLLFDESFDRSVSDSDLACEDRGGAAAYAVLAMAVIVIVIAFLALIIS